MYESPTLHYYTVTENEIALSLECQSGNPTFLVDLQNFTRIDHLFFSFWRPRARITQRLIKAALNHEAKKRNRAQTYRVQFSSLCISVFISVDSQHDNASAIVLLNLQSLFSVVSPVSAETSETKMRVPDLSTFGIPRDLSHLNLMLNGRVKCLLYCRK